MSQASLFVNGRILTKAGKGSDGQPTFVDCMIVKDGKVAAVGSRESLGESNVQGLDVRDLQQRTVLPSFIDGHMHLLLLGQSLRKADLTQCTSVEDIRATIKAYALANPEAKSIMCKNWFHHMTPDGVTAAMLDDIDPRPIFIDNSSLHSCWCNTAALKVLGADDLPDPAGGKIHRGPDGKANGLLDEGAMMSIIWPYQASSVSREERIEAIRAAISEYNAAGYTGVVEMAMDEEAWDALIALHEREPELPIRVAAYWLIRPTTDHEENSKQVRRAIEMSRLYGPSNNMDLRIVGIKLILDGIIDACTAFLSQPYGDAALPPPVWLQEHMEPVVREADEGGLQIALHAIGDAAVKMAVDSIEKYGTIGRRHRIEHIELASPEDAVRLGKLGLTASVQPVHADPFILKAWNRLLGAKRATRAFAYREFADAGALLALGSDSPTSPYAPFENLYVATTRRSAREPAYTETVNENFRLGLCESIVASTDGAARSVFLEDVTGSLEVGKSADFVVVDMEWDATRLLGASVEQTWFRGREVWSQQA
ncbi:amidohydrolase 3 [Plectosphaerella cucumerina]|uniref:Amidohydrolase 3 n=1 Tax=Plectosphaerella cucumerina TaxID=40658 RepID=A0A8K0WZC9_9PEZI|nr:amidohydrolase 3 [Plectosphaerella cucumerina]